MNHPISPAATRSGFERVATEKELSAALLAFEAEVYRADPLRLGRATEAAHAALQSHLDAIAANCAVIRRELGI